MARPDLSAAESVLHDLAKATAKAGTPAVKPKAPKVEASPAPKVKSKGATHTASNFKHTRTSPRGK